MNKTISVVLSSKLNCCIGDTVSLNVRAVEKLTSYGSACETSAIPALIVGAGLNSDGTFTYVVRYDSCVLRDICNYLLPVDIESVCCIAGCNCKPTPCNYVRTCCGN